MCPTHHRAYDQNLVQIADDYRVVVQRDRLEHVGSSATNTALVAFDGRRIALPREVRYRPGLEFLRPKRRIAA